MFCLVVLAGVLISKLSIDPLQEHVQNLQNLSKETLHELNLPVTTIMTNTHMLKNKTQDEKMLKRLSRIENACGILQERYNELDYMIKTQTQREIKEAFALDKLIEERVAFLSPLYPSFEFEVSVQKTQIISDKIGLAKVIDNIIENGVKFSQTTKKIKILLKDNILRIQDYGCGIEDSELLRIFDHYYQSNQNMQGFGIGLGMIKRFCDKQNIELSIDSKVDVGTTLELKFKDNN